MNKIKGSSSAVKMKYLLFVFAAAVLVALPTRVYQLLALVDASNGFYKESDVTVPVLYAVLVVFGLLFLVLSFISKEVPSPKLPAGKNMLLGIASFVITGGLAWDMFRTISDIIPVNQGNAAIFMSLLKTNLAQKGGAFTILEFVFAFFAIIYFIVFGISHLNGKASYKEFKLLALSPLCWSMTILIKKLMNPISFIKVSELLFEIFMFVFVMLFFITFARISSGVFTEDSMWGIYGYGLVTALLAAIVTIPRIVIALVGLEAVDGHSFDFSHLAILVFVMAYVFASLGVGFKDGLKNRKTVIELNLPDELEIVSKKADFVSFPDDDSDDVDEIEEKIEEKSFIKSDEIFSEDSGFANIEEENTDTVNEDFDMLFDDSDFKPLEEPFLECCEESAEEVSEKQVEENIEESVEEESEEVVEEIQKETESDEMKIITLADLKKKNQE